MPEYLAIVVVIAGLLVLGAVFLMHTLNKVMQTVKSGNAELTEKLASLNETVTSLQNGLSEHSRELDAIRSEFALNLTRRETGEAEYELAIKAAANGETPQEVQEAYGLREAEAQLLVAVYGNNKKNKS